MQQATLAATAATKASAAAPSGGDDNAGAAAGAAHSAFSAMALASSNNNGGTRAPPLSSLGAHSMMHMQLRWKSAYGPCANDPGLGARGEYPRSSKERRVCANLVLTTREGKEIQYLFLDADGP